MFGSGRYASTLMPNPNLSSASQSWLARTTVWLDLSFLGLAVAVDGVVYWEPYELPTSPYLGDQNTPREAKKATSLWSSFRLTEASEQRSI